MDGPLAANRRLWDEWTAVHASSDHYDVEGFKRGTRHREVDAGPGIRVRRYEVAELGDVRGRDLLHLQCHFGIDTLSWARLGARVTGVDFSEPAIQLANGLAEELGLDARFVHSTVEDLPEHLTGDFDVVYTSRGAIWWLRDLGRWAEVIVRFLRPGGVFYMTEFHPFAQSLDDEGDDPRPRNPYFPHPEPQAFPTTASYAAPHRDGRELTEHGWAHSLGEVVTALAEAGLRIEFLHEFDSTDFRMAPWLEEVSTGVWRLRSDIEGELPLMYSVKATKGAGG